jgi:GntR family transcriptional regulator
VELDDTIETPLHEQLANILRERITSGELSGRMPSIRTLTQEFGVAQGTAARAMGILKDEGIVTVRVGRGAFTVKR